MVIGEFGLDVVEFYLPIVLVAGGYFEDHPQEYLLFLQSVELLVDLEGVCIGQAVNDDIAAILYVRVIDLQGDAGVEPLIFAFVISEL